MKILKYALVKHRKINYICHSVRFFRDNTFKNGRI